MPSSNATPSLCFGNVGCDRGVAGFIAHLLIGEVL